MLMRNVGWIAGIAAVATIIAVALLTSHLGGAEAAAAHVQHLADWCAGNGGPCIPTIR